MMVTESDLVDVSGNIGAEVLSTHCLVWLMELAARKVAEGRIPEDKITLGTRVDIRHFSAALVGSRVRAVARLIAIEHHRLFFHIAAYDDVEKLAEGENEQVIVYLLLFAYYLFDLTRFIIAQWSTGDNQGLNERRNLPSH
jgi:fluoroacetyl-CoA thioesterase